MARKAYEVKGATASGPYSAAVDAGDLVYFSGQTAMNSVSAKIWKVISAHKQSYASRVYSKR